MCRATKTLMTSMQTEPAEVEDSMALAGRFLTDYTASLWGCGATCVRVEKNVRRIAGSYGYRSEITILPGHLSIVLSREGEEPRLFTQIIHPKSIDFTMNAELSALSWNISDNRVPIAQARREFNRIVEPHRHGDMRIALLASMANASFCRLFGGDAGAMGVVFAATLVGMFFKHILMGARVDNRVVFFLCAMLSAMLCAGATLFNISATPEIAQATCVLYLIPGVPYINAAGDFIARHYLCAASRLADAAVLTAALSAGLYLGLYLERI